MLLSSINVLFRLFILCSQVSNFLLALAAITSKPFIFSKEEFILTGSLQIVAFFKLVNNFMYSWLKSIKEFNPSVYKSILFTYSLDKGSNLSGAFKFLATPLKFIITFPCFNKNLFKSL